MTPQDNAARRLAFSTSAEARGLAPADPGLDAALGRDLRLTLRGETDEAGVARLDEARLVSPTLSLFFEGRLAETLVDGRASIAITRLAAFSRLTGLALGGSAILDAVLAGNPSSRVVTATLSGRTQALKLGDARLERLLGEALRLEGRIASADNGLTITGLKLARRRGGGATGRQARRLRRGARRHRRPARPACARSASGGTGQRRSAPDRARADPSLTLALSAAEAMALGRPVRDLAVSLDARSIIAAPRVQLSGNGSIGGKPLRWRRAQTRQSPVAAGGSSSSPLRSAPLPSQQQEAWRLAVSSRAMQGSPPAISTTCRRWR